MDPLPWMCGKHEAQLLSLQTGIYCTLCGDDFIKLTSEESSSVLKSSEMLSWFMVSAVNQEFLCRGDPDLWPLWAGGGGVCVCGRFQSDSVLSLHPWSSSFWIFSHSSIYSNQNVIVDVIPVQVQRFKVLSKWYFFGYDYWVTPETEEWFSEASLANFYPTWNQAHMMILMTSWHINSHLCCQPSQSAECFQILLNTQSLKIEIQTSTISQLSNPTWR